MSESGPGGILTGFIVAFIIVIAVIGIILVADVVVNLLDSVKGTFSQALNTTQVDYYSNLSESVVSNLGYVVVGFILFIIVAYAIHIKRR
ncbi:MAG: hypothetical protein LM558_00120 [Thermosphaera sp.]|nr:hypothetical protein [Thermosphaera sp.]